MDESFIYPGNFTEEEMNDPESLQYLYIALLGGLREMAPVCETIDHTLFSAEDVSIEHRIGLNARLIGAMVGGLMEEDLVKLHQLKHISTEYRTHVYHALRMTSIHQERPYKLEGPVDKYSFATLVRSQNLADTLSQFINAAIQMNILDEINQ